jgi:hypothetical protein
VSVCVRRRRAGEVEFSSSSLATARRRHRRGGGGSRSRDCKLRLRPAGIDEGGGLGLGQGLGGAGVGGIIYGDGDDVEGRGLDGPCRADPLCRPGRVPPDRPHFRPRPNLQYQGVRARPAALSCQAVLGSGRNRPGLVPPVQPGPFGHL